ncbi:hypothetical protein ACLB2K_053102 [Fragaria x ananassa]
MPLRCELFQKKFAYCFVQKTEKYNETGDTYQKFTLKDHNPVLQRSVSREVWSFDTSSCNLEKCYLSTYNVLQCYLESTLQVGVIHEIIGNGAEAEVYLQWGKTISCSQCLPLFTVAFCSVLGKLYLKKQLWDLAEEELQSAKQYLKANKKESSCLNSKNAPLEKSSCPESLYKSALTKLMLPEWKNSVSCPGLTVLKEVGNSAGSPYSHFAETKMDPKGKREAKKYRSQSSHNQSVKGTGVQVGDSKHLK